MTLAQILDIDSTSRCSETWSLSSCSLDAKDEEQPRLRPQNLRLCAKAPRPLASPLASLCRGCSELLRAGAEGGWGGVCSGHEQRDRRFAPTQRSTHMRTRNVAFFLTPLRVPNIGFDSY
eukprot:Amastigsp_a10487_18.p2 type:complete len:120 gc:universal Amastigsp_a10487_18:580-221(-)